MPYKNPEQAKAYYAAYHAANKEKIKLRCQAWRVANKEKYKASYIAWRAANPEKVKEMRKSWVLANREKVIESMRSWHIKNPERSKANNKKWRDNNREKLKVIGATYRANNRERVLAHYSQGKFVCACCGDNRKCFLTIDHIVPIGSQKRKALGEYGQLSGRLVAHNFPVGYQILCMNCNFLKRNLMSCPCGTKYPITQAPVVQFNAPLTNQ